MLSILLFEFQVIEEDSFACASFMLIWKKEKNKDLLNGLTKYKTTTKQYSLKSKTEYKHL